VGRAKFQQFFRDFCVLQLVEKGQTGLKQKYICDLPSVMFGWHAGRDAGEREHDGFFSPRPFKRGLRGQRCPLTTVS